MTRLCKPHFTHDPLRQPALLPLVPGFLAATGHANQAAAPSLLRC
jgi:hypothetical protein